VILGAAVGVFGVAFGVLAGTAGASVSQAMAMSVLIFTGASQFAAASVIDSGGTAPAAIASALLLAARNGFYALTVARDIGTSLTKRILGAQFVIDESAAMATSQQTLEDRSTAFWWTGLSVFVFWNLGTLLGVASGSAIGDPETLGLDAAFPAGFIALMMPSLKRRSGQVAALVGGAIALAAVPLTPPGIPVLLAALATVPAAWVAHTETQAPDIDPNASTR
jgi:4-azaleucine resistance transporter AzlC